MCGVKFLFTVLVVLSIKRSDSQPTIADEGSCSDVEERLRQLEEEILLLRKSKEVTPKTSLDVPCGYVGGITRSEGKIFIVCSEPKLLLVLEDGEGFRKLEKIPLRMVSEAYDAVFNSQTNSLYVNDHQKSCIWKISITVGYNVTKWMTGITEPNTFSLTNEGQLLLLRDAEPNSKLEIYDWDARLNRTIELPETIKTPLHAIQTPAGNYLVGHSLTLGDNSQISQLTSRGQIINRFIPKDKSQEIPEAWHLALDSDGHRLFVADYKNHRVVILDSDSLSWKQVFLTKRDCIRSPWKLIYDRIQKRLFVAGWEGEANIYNVKLSR